MEQATQKYSCRVGSVLDLGKGDQKPVWQRQRGLATPYKYLMRMSEILNELDFMGSPCTKDCSGHKAGYEWSLKKGGAIAASPSNSFNNGARIGQRQATQRPQGGGKRAGYTSQTAGAMRRRQQRLAAQQAAQAAAAAQQPQV